MNRICEGRQPRGEKSHLSKVATAPHDYFPTKRLLRSLYGGVTDYPVVSDHSLMQICEVTLLFK